VIVDEAPPQCSMASEVAALIAEDRASLDSLRAPVARVCGASVPIPYSPPLEDAALPDVARTLAAIEAVMR
jgi:pyruvate dehydrogenase E1 component beta subunit